jgi:membrane protein required for colicin V production
MNSHQIVDIVVLAVLLYCMVKGASRGLLSQLAWVIALLLCFKFSGTLAPAIEPMIGVAPPLKQWIAMLVVYVGLCGVSFVAAGMLSSWMEKARVIDFDKHLGGVLGLIKGVIICMTGLFFAITMSEPMRLIVSKTYSGLATAHILNLSQHVIPMLPEHTVPTVQNVIDEFNRRLQPVGDDLNGATPSDADTFGDGSFAGSNGLDDDFDLSKYFPDPGTGNYSPKNRPRDRDVTIATPSLQDLLSRVPAQLRRELTQQAMDSLRSSSPEEKQRLLERLGTGIPENAGVVLDDFLRQRTEAGGQGMSPEAHPAARLGKTETTLLSEIAGIYSQRDDVAANTKRYLAGVPSLVQRRVLEDWHADAIGLNLDPDPSTDVNTRLDDRIVRQLSKAGILMDRLDRDLRNRLSGAVDTSTSYGRN